LFVNHAQKPFIFFKLKVGAKAIISIQITANEYYARITNSLFRFIPNRKQEMTNFV